MFNDIIDLFKVWACFIGIEEQWIQLVVFCCITLFFLYLIIRMVWKGICIFFKHRLRVEMNKDLQPYYSKADVRNATRYFIPTQYQNLSPTEDDEPGRKYIASAKNLLIPLFMDQIFVKDLEDEKYFLVLADSGMGKTTFLINLYMEYVKKKRYPWHLPKPALKIFPLGSPDILQAIAGVTDKEKTILFLDAFDEDVLALQDYHTRLKELLAATWKFKAIIITCRTQFFPSKKEEPHDTGYASFGESGEYKFQKAYLSVFTTRDIQSYLCKIFPPLHFWKWKKYWKAKRIVRKSPNLMVRPMLLSHIRDLVKSKRPFNNSYEVYEMLINKWIEREAKKPGIREKYGSTKRYEELLKKFTTALALNLYQHREKRKGYYINKDEDFGIEGFGLAELESDHVKFSDAEKRSRSLLNRNAEGNYKFAHKSILDYIIARELMLKKESLGKYAMEPGNFTLRFYLEMLIEIMKTSVGHFYTANGKKKELLHLRVDDINDLNTIEFIEVGDIQWKLARHFTNIGTIRIGNRTANKLLHTIYALYLLTIDYHDEESSNCSFTVYLHSNERTKLDEFDVLRKIIQEKEIFKLTDNQDIINHSHLLAHLNLLDDKCIVMESSQVPLLPQFYDYQQSIKIDVAQARLFWKEKSQLLSALNFHFDTFYSANLLINTAEFKLVVNLIRKRNRYPDLNELNGYLKDPQAFEKEFPGIRLVY